MKKVLEALTQMQIKMPIQTVVLVLVIAFLVSLIMITMVTTIVMVVIGSNISVSLGMVGALSIIRFRTAVKDPRDTAFIFWCVVSGLACGTQNYTIVIVGSIFICLILFLFKKLATRDNKYILIVKGNRFDITAVEKTVSKLIKHYNCKGKYVNKDSIEIIYDIKFKKEMNDKIIYELGKINGVSTINVVASNTDTMG